MGIQRYEYEISVWKESLSEQGQRKEEKKMAIIGGNDMTYLGRATNIKFTTKINGTHTLTFDMPDKYFDSEKGDYIHNEFVDALFNECKIKFHYKGKWYEFYVKDVKDSKKFKSYLKSYTCSDVFIDELSRNGYGITFDQELYNNVEEVGTFSEEILEDSVWEYDAHLNWGDFTEYAEEKLFKVPLSLFNNNIVAHKLNYEVSSSEEIQNIFTGDARAVEMGDDLARELGQFWDQYGGGANPLLTESITISEGDYIYIPYSQLDFCYVSTEPDNGLEAAYAATEEPGIYTDHGYAISPSSVDPNKLIQFIYIPDGEKVEIDEAGLIVNKNFTYVMTVEEWNQNISHTLFYYFEDYKEEGQKIKALKEKTSVTSIDYTMGNWAGYYDGYLTEYGDLEVESGKKISVTDRTEVNISEEIDQYVTVYNNSAVDYKDLYQSEEWIFDSTRDADYRVCSKIDTRQVVPQLARNLVQNGTKISSTTGWEPMESNVANQTTIGTQIAFGYTEAENFVNVDTGAEQYTIDVGGVEESYLIVAPACRRDSKDNNWSFDGNKDELLNKNAIVNFGIIGQEKQIEKGRIYALGINIRTASEDSISKLGTDVSAACREINGDIKNISDTYIRIGDGELVADGDYQFKNRPSAITFSIKRFIKSGDLNRNSVNAFILFSSMSTYKNPYIAIYSNTIYELISLQLFEAYTKGADQFDDEDLVFKYSGRDLFNSYVPHPQNPTEPLTYKYSLPYYESELRKLILFEDTVMSGDTFGYNRYFIQQLKTKDNQTFDTFMAKQYLSEDGSTEVLPLDSGRYTDDDYEIITNYIDLNACDYYNEEASITACDCNFGSSEYDKICLYQKYGFCPYRFQTEKHCRKIRTLNGEKSNRFNLTQEIGKVFEVYPMYWTSHDDNSGRILTQRQAYDTGLRSKITGGREDWMDKRIFYITEKGKENKLGFRYEKNLSDISRTINSDQIVTKLYVLDTDSQLSRTGICSIKTAEDNPSKDSFIIDFSYYTTQGLLDKEKTMADLYGVDNNDIGYLKTLGYLNTQYDKLSNQIINLNSASFTELQANLDVNLTGIETAQKKLRGLEKKMSRYTVKGNSDYKTNSTFISYQNEYIEQYAIYSQLIKDTFYTDNNYDAEALGGEDTPEQYLKNHSIEYVRSELVDKHCYTCGILGQYNEEYLQIQEWTKEQSQYLKRINQISLEFYQKYEPYLKEGTWSDGNYLTDNAYYLDALQVAKEGAIPSVSYSITVSDIEPLYKEGDYEFEIADTTYVEDIGMFGINPKTGLPNRLKVLVSETTEDPDVPNDNKINVQDFTTQFEDLFQQVTATVQTLTFNEQIYNRASNFTSQQNVKTESLQGTLNENNLDLVNTQENNIQINWNGQSGSDINNHNNKYKLNGQGLFFSNNGGESWNTAITPNGINADYLKAGAIDTSKIRLVDGNYIYFTWDNSGIKAYRNPDTVDNAKAFKDYAQFNKYGLSLVQSDKIRLRAGYQFRQKGNTTGGNINDELDIQGDTPLGFYLYNSKGNAIFATQNSDDDSEIETARINLVGEILATNDANVTQFSNYSYGGTTYKKVSGYYYPLGDANDVVHKFNDSQISISGTIGTFEINVSNMTVTRDDYAAFIAYQYQELTQIIIAENDHGTITNYTYTPNGIQVDTLHHHKNGQIQISSSNIRYVIFTIYTINFTDHNNVKIFVLESLNEQQPESYAFKKDKSITAVGGVFYYIESNPTSLQTILPKVSLSGINQSNPHYDNYRGFYYYDYSTVNNLYNINEYYYSKCEETSYTSDGVIALYINNRTDLNQQQIVSDNSRLFVCCKSSKNSENVPVINNIFSILKNGSLYMGGTIRGQVDASSLPDQIDIDYPYLTISSDGKLKMSFDDIVNTTSEESLATYVANQLSGTVETLEERTHSHYIPPSQIIWGRGQTILDPINSRYVDIRNITVSLTYDDNGNIVSFDKNLYELLNDELNYYQNLEYGYIYTDSASI